MSNNVKEAMRELVETLPDDCTWDDVIYRVYVRRKIAAGLEDVAAGRVIDHEEVFAELLHDPDQVDRESA